MTPSVQEIHLIFKTHLDIGFTDFARNVVETYFNVYIPKAIETARALREKGHKERFVWTTGSWLIYEYLDRADAAGRRQLENAIAAGDITWHGLPFTMHSELLDPSLFRFGLGYAQELDWRFGKKTIAAKMSDVPGHTRGIVPLLAEAGIRFLHIGVNSASTPPDVPPVFVWSDTRTACKIIVMYQTGYGDSMTIPGLNTGIAFAHTDDNIGPQSEEQVIRAYRKTHQRFPSARIMASTLDAFAEELCSIESQLPVFSGEIGDTWIHGVGTDPAKVSRYRELARLRQGWLDSERVRLDAPHLNAFSRFLLMIPEHTWGLDEKTHLNDYDHYDADKLRAARKTERFRRFEASWAEQRAYIDTAINALEGSALHQEAADRLHALEPALPDTTGFTRVTDQLQIFDTPDFEIGIDPLTGAVSHLIDRRTGRNWASRSHRLGLFRYETFSQQDYDLFWQKYIINKRKTRVWSFYDFTKPGIASAANEHRFWVPQLAEMYVRSEASGLRLLLELTVQEESVTRYGCPRQIVMEIETQDGQRSLNFTVQWFNKQACRLPEALWCSFTPKILSAGTWELDKLGQRVSPLDVVSNGNRKLHAVNSGVYYSDERGRLAIETLDAPLVAPGAPSLLGFNNRQPPLRKGMHFNLFNNVWGTNFTMWYDEDARFRFVLRFDDQ